MAKVKNKKIITTLAKRNFTANRGRNVVAVLAIILTTVLFTSLFIVGGSMINLSQQSTFRMVGTSSHGGFKALTQEQYDVLQKHPSIKDFSYNIPIAIADNNKLSKIAVEIRYSEDKSAKWGMSYPTAGTMPTKNNEIATSTVVLDALGLAHEIGTEVPLTFSAKNKEYDEVFILSGYWEGDTINAAQQAFVNYDYAIGVAPIPQTPYFEQEIPDVMGTINADLWFSNSTNIEDKILKVIADSGYEIEKISYGVNWGYTTSGLDITSLISVFAFLLVIMLSGYLIIYNIFYISVSKDIQYYGLLKTIGTTGKQIKTILRKQSLYLCIFGVPLGLLLGYFLGKMILPSILDTTILKGESSVPLSPWIFIFSAVFTIATVFISTRSSEKKASKVSPIEAIRTTDVSSTNKKKTRKTRKISIFSIAINNVFRNKKKLFSVVTSLFLSVIIVIAVYTLISGFNMDMYISNMSISDFQVTDPALKTRYEYTTMDNSVKFELELIDGVEKIGAVYMQEIFSFDIPEHVKNNINIFYAEIGEKPIETVNTPLHVYGVDPVIYDKIEFCGEESEFDERFNSGNYVYVNPLKIGEHLRNKPVEFFNYEIGDKVTIDFENGNSKEYEVLGYAAVPFSAGIMHSHENDPNFILPSEEYLAQAQAIDPIHILFNVDLSKEADVEIALKQYTENNNLVYTSRETLKEEFREMEMMYVVVGGTLVSILSLIGILNFMNSMFTSVLTRKIEIATLQSIGMTVKNVKNMLVFEGLIHGGLVILLASTIGQLFVYILVNLIEPPWYFSYQLTYVPFLICVPIIVIISLIIPIVSYISFSGESLIERLRVAS